MGRGDIDVQSVFAITVLIFSVIALGTTGHTSRAAYNRDVWRSGPPPLVTRTYTRSGYRTSYGASYTTSSWIGTTAYTTTVTDSNWYRRQVAQENSTVVATPTPTTTASMVASTATPGPTTTITLPSGPATALHSSSSSAYHGGGTRVKYSEATVGAIVNIPWLALLAVYLIAFLLVRHRRPDSWFVSVTADLWFLGFFWLAGISCGIITPWWIWEIVAAKRYRAGLGTSLVRLVEEQQARRDGMAMGNVEEGGFRPLPEHETFKPLTVDLDTVAKDYLAREAPPKSPHPPPFPYPATRT
ncbi:uncharacterized protein LOC62_03G003581 [Vanrija pseudolonga]|uniref:Uncharacterized protein n=1 Tax=Vanrija pseudolonga TaxID=143232 RepID=A0AAF1BKV4_9TREE|nr:hypothetical protein LOC62_03G003581 [Vanrija pseudolonga]